jgi:hypothetical protein
MEPDRSHAVAEELHGWFEEVLRLADRGLFGIAPEGRHRSVVILNVLTRNARIILDSRMDEEGTLYTPLSLFLASGCRKLKISLGVGHWRAAVENVCRLSEQMGAPEAPAEVALDLGSPAAIFLQEFRESILQAGLAGARSYLDRENREIALGLAINWGMRFLLAYALECPLRRRSGPKDLAWIRALFSDAPARRPHRRRR